MDSLTQAALGAATFALVKERDIGRSSLLIGAIVGTLPDLDVVLRPFFHEAEFLGIHRSFSHSLFLFIPLSAVLGELFHRIYHCKHRRSSWYMAFFIALLTHSLLDWCTTYGTKLFSPVSSHIFTTNNIHILEPFYTLSLVAGTLIAASSKKKIRLRRRAVRLALLVSTVYLGWTFISKGIANRQFLSELDKQSITYERIWVSPTPLNSILWQAIVEVENGYYFARYSLFDDRDEIQFYFERNHRKKIDSVANHPLINTYLTYTQGLPLVKVDKHQSVRIYAVKFGPINYAGPPKFDYPLKFNLDDLEPDSIKIVNESGLNGPIHDFKGLMRRVAGKKNADCRSRER